MTAKAFFKYARLGPYLVFCYFNWILPYSKHPEKKPIEYRYAKFRKLAKHAMRILNPDLLAINVDIINKQDKPFLGITNHRHYTDPFYYAYFSEKPVSFIGKKEVEKIPFVGRVFKAIDGYFIDREDLMSQVRLFRKIAERMKKGDTSYFIFPEGTRMKDKDSIKTLPYKDGSLKLAYWAGVDVIYVAHIGTESVLMKAKPGHKKSNVTFKFFDKIKYEDIKDKSTVEVMPIIERNTNEALIELNKMNNERGLKENIKAIK